MAAPRKNNYATLVSGDGHEYVVPMEATKISKVLVAALNNDFSEGKSKRVELVEISSMVLEKVAEYLIYWYRFKDQDDVPDMDIPVHLCLEILQAADYLKLDDYGLTSYRKDQVR